MDKDLLEAIKSVLATLDIRVNNVNFFEGLPPKCPYDVTVYVPYTKGFVAISVSQDFKNVLQNRVCTDDLECEDMLSEMGNFVVAEFTKKTPWVPDFPVIIYSKDMLPVFIDTCNMLLVETSAGPLKVLYV